MRLFGPLHVGLLVVTAAAAVVLSRLCRQERIPRRAVRVAIGYGLVVNELIWWRFRYSREGIHLRNLPLQLCDATLWMSAAASIKPASPIVEFAYFAGMAGAGMALLTPDLWSPWPTYPAIYFFLAPYWVIFITLLYYDYRVRREGFDVRVLSLTSPDVTLETVLDKGADS